jgi:UDP-glucose 4-epimerase
MKTKSRPVHILLTGGAAFIGSHVVDIYLRAGHRVTVVDNLATGTLATACPRLSQGGRGGSVPLVVNIGTGQELSVNEMFYLLKSFQPRVPEPIYAPPKPGEQRRSVEFDVKSQYVIKINSV